MILTYYIIFYQRSLIHFLLTDCHQPSHIQYLTHGLRYSLQKFLFTVLSNQLSVGLFYDFIFYDDHIKYDDDYYFNLILSVHMYKYINR